MPRQGGTLLGMPDVGLQSRLRPNSRAGIVAPVAPEAMQFRWILQRSTVAGASS